MKSKTATSLLAFGLAGLALPALAADWPQFRGPSGDSRTPEHLGAKQWPQSGPKELWRAPLNAGFSSITVQGGKAFTLIAEMREGANREVCVALDANTGKTSWNVPIGIAKYDGGGDSGTPDNSGGDGPRGTPSVDQGKVFVMSGQLKLYCLDAANGNILWQKDLVADFHGHNIQWQNAASPVVEGGLVLVAGGGPNEALIAFNEADGSVAWKGQDDKMTHATPTMATIQGVRQAIFFTQKGLVSVAPKTGDVLWRYPFRYSVSTASSPVVGGDIVYCTAGYGVGAAAVKITRDGSNLTATEIWKVDGKTLNNHWSTPLYYKGCLYGLFGFKEYGSCPLKCVDLATGTVKWSKDGFGPGGLILVDDQLVVLDDRGELVLVKATPDEYSESARFKAVSGKCWSTPTMANGHIFARSTKEGVCLDVTGRSAAR